MFALNVRFLSVFCQQDVEKELQQEMALKQELEMVVKFNESDLSHKQQGLVALRQQLDNVKMANADLYLKLQVLA